MSPARQTGARIGELIENCKEKLVMPGLRSGQIQGSTSPVPDRL